MSPLSVASWPLLDHPPWRLSGVVVGAALNDPGWLDALGERVHAPPYKGPPRAPVLVVKPRHTFAPAGAPMVLPAGAQSIEVGATVGLVVAATACRIRAEDAARHIGGALLAVDLALPLASWYRPAAGARALDGSLRLAAAGRCAGASALESFDLRVQVDGRLVLQAGTAAFTRQPAQLLADVSAFMTLHEGDLLLLGVPCGAGAPLARAGQTVRIEADGLGAIEFPVVSDEAKGHAAAPCGATP